MSRIGEKHGKLIIIGLSPTRANNRNKRYVCRCDCGRIVTVRADSIGITLSCGCLHKEKVTKHGMEGTPIYRQWCRIKVRCNNHEDKNYHGRGIKVCENWLSDFTSFYQWAIRNGWQKNLEIDRIDNDGEYSPDNCRFVTKDINSQNRSTSKRWVIDGIVFDCARLAGEYFGVSGGTINNWCKGRYRFKKRYFTPPKEGCSAYLKYGEI
jgi:hypothetical protein